MPSPDEPRPGRDRGRILCALAFWALTYLLFVAWNQLQTEFPISIWQTRRAATTGIGAALFWLFAWLADRLAGRPWPAQAVRLLPFAFGCCVAMIGARALVDALIVAQAGEPLSTLERHIRFALIWGGYFAGGALAYVSFTVRRPAAAEVPLTEPIAESTPEPAAEPEFPEALWVSRGRETVRVAIDAIDWIEAEGDYVRLHARGHGGLLRGTLSGLEATLDPAVFARVHRSAICRKSAVVAMVRKPSGAMAVRLEDGAEVPVGRRYRDAVSALIGPGREPARMTA